MRYAITIVTIPQNHLKPRYTKDSTVRACAERAHAYASAGKKSLARFARSWAPGSLRCPSLFPPMPLPIPSNPLARYARSGFLPPACRGNPCTSSSGQGKRLCHRISTPLCPIPSDAPPDSLVLRAAVRLRLSVGLLPTGSKSLAFRAVCSRASLPQCANMFGGSPAPCGGRACRGGPRPALQALRPACMLTHAPRSCALMGRCALRARIGRDAAAASATLRPKVCNAAAGVFRCYRRFVVQLPSRPIASATFPRLR